MIKKASYVKASYRFYRLTFPTLDEQFSVCDRIIPLAKIRADNILKDEKQFLIVQIQGL